MKFYSRYLKLGNFFFSLFFFFSMVWWYVGRSGCGLIVEVELLSGGVWSICFPLFFDLYGTRFCLVVLLISFCVMAYREFYMEDCQRCEAYSLLVKCFVSCIIIFISVPNIFGIMVG
jgi:NADH:ubiquinone oxidoreductase subunit 5 (subunit L)/multisubunit Na+/H+ antiporter MnhA subunit